MTTETLDLAAIKAEHARVEYYGGIDCAECVYDNGLEAVPAPWPCAPYLLAAELSEVRAQLATTEAKIARVESVRRYKVDGETWVCDAADVDRALRSSVGARLQEEA